MSELRQRLLEAAEAATREGQIPSAAVVVKRGRRRRLRQAGATAVLVVLALVAGVVGAGWLTDRPSPLTPTPTTRPTPTTEPTSTTGPTSTTAPMRPWIPSVTPLDVRAQPGQIPDPFVDQNPEEGLADFGQANPGRTAAGVLVARVHEPRWRWRAELGHSTTSEAVDSHRRRGRRWAQPARSRGGHGLQAGGTGTGVVPQGPSARGGPR
jgi:hypothetical protein